MKNKNKLNVITGIIASMFFYAAINKLSNYELALNAMRNQIFPDSVAEVLTWLIPTSELLLAFCLIYQPTRIIALHCSIYLLLIFTLYIVLIRIGVFNRIPCSCGGIISQLSYGWHFVFNVFFILIALAGIQVSKTDLRYSSKPIN